MRFKIFYDEKKHALDISCKVDNATYTILPDDTEQHVYFPLPVNFMKNIKNDLFKLINQDDVEEYIFPIYDNTSIKDIRDRRCEFMKKIREKYNPMIIKKCENYRLEYPEYFI